jgi:ribosomal protein S18 acetylase RimI-like enzyme
MIRANYKDRDLVVSILTKSFADNKSVNYIIKQDNNKLKRIKKLMEYSYDVCNLFGDIFLSDDKNGCALLIFPEKKRTNIKSILLDVKFAVACLGLPNLQKAIRREAIIEQVHPKGVLYYLWFIGVEPNNQHTGIGSRLMNEIISEAKKQNRQICLETSTVKNIPWYEKFGFTIYCQLDFGYELFSMKRE